MVAVIFGIKGQDGWYLENLLNKLNIRTIGLGRENEYSVSLGDYYSVANFIQFHKPDYIFHFAANSTTNHAMWKENYETILTGTLNILESVKSFSPHTKVFISGSGLQFVNLQQPIKETDAFHANSIYSATRISSVYMGRYYRSLGIQVYVGYFFNHDSPRRSERHINKKITAAVSRIAKGSTEKLQLGDITVKKEFGFAGDMVEAVWLLVNQSDIHEAVIGTGTSYTIEDWLKICFEKFRLNWDSYVEIIPGFIPDYRNLQSDPSTLLLLGWTPKVSINDLAELMFNDL